MCLLQSLQQQLQQQQQQQQQQSDADNIKVVVRLRPLFPHEQSKGAAEVAHVSEDYSSLKVQTLQDCSANSAHAAAHSILYIVKAHGRADGYATAAARRYTATGCML
jgi:hypothetical protein